MRFWTNFDSFNVLDLLILTSCILSFLAVSCCASRNLAGNHAALERTVPGEHSVPPNSTSETIHHTEEPDLLNTRLDNCSSLKDIVMVFRDQIIERQSPQAKDWITPGNSCYPSGSTRKVYKPDPSPLRRLAKALRDSQTSSLHIDEDVEKIRHSTPSPREATTSMLEEFAAIASQCKGGNDNISGEGEPQRLESVAFDLAEGIQGADTVDAITTSSETIYTVNSDDELVVNLQRALDEG